MSHPIYALSRGMAWFGGAVLTLIALMSVASIAGRALSGFGLGPVPGDFELVEAGAALAVFCFLPWCHLRRGHAVVDLFWNTYPKGLQRVLSLLTDLAMAAVWVLLVWRMGLATVEYRANGEVSFILQMPVWWGYAASMLPAVACCVVYVWRVLEDLGWATEPAGFGSGGGGH